MYYNFELVMAGAILLTAMLVGGIALRIKRSRDIDETDVSASKSTSVKNFPLVLKWDNILLKPHQP